MAKQEPVRTKKAGSINLKPLADRVIVKEMDAMDGAHQTKGGIFIPDTSEKDSTLKRGEVVAVGPGKFDEDGERRVPMSVAVGDTVVYQWGDKIKVDDEEYTLVREPDIVATIK